MADNKAAKEILTGLDKASNDMINSFTLEELIAHWHAEIRVHKKAQAHDASWAFSAEKLAALEKAVEEFEIIYEAEKAEAEKCRFPGTKPAASENYSTKTVTLDRFRTHALNIN